MTLKKPARLYSFGLAFLLCAASEAFADPAVLFDFNTLGQDFPSAASRGRRTTTIAAGTDAIETYMENLYGADITVTQGAHTSKTGIKVKRKFTHLGNSDGAVGVTKLSKKLLKLQASDTFLVNPALVKGAQAQLTLDFGNKPITSFEFDFEIFPIKKKKLPAELTVKADGETIFKYSASKIEKKTGYLGHQSLFVFDGPVHKLEFIGTPNTPIGIDNLLVNAFDSSSSSSGGIDGSQGGGSPFNKESGGLPSEEGGPSNSTFSVTSDSAGDGGPSGDGYVGILQEVPEPSSWLLIGAGLAALTLSRFRFVRA